MILEEQDQNVTKIRNLDEKVQKRKDKLTSLIWDIEDVQNTWKK